MANFAYGQWVDPTEGPTGGSIAAPINSGSTPPSKKVATCQRKLLVL